MARKLLTSNQLAEYVVDISHQPKLWRHLVDYSESRSYKLLADTPSLNCWVITWNVGHDTGMHDHDGSSGGVVVVDGIVYESRLFESTEADHLSGELIEKGEQYSTGMTFQFGPSAIHRVKHFGKKPAVSIHAYSPPLKRMGSYGVGENREFVRLPMKKDEELKPLEIAAKDVSKSK